MTLRCRPATLWMERSVVRMALVVSIVMTLLLAPAAMAQQATPEASAAAGSLDLAAMALTPDDLPWAGFAVGSGQTRDADQLAADATDYLSGDAKTIASTLAD